MIQFIKLSFNPTDHGYYIGLSGISIFYILAYLIEYQDFKKRISSLLRIVLEVALIILLLCYPLIIHKIFDISFISMCTLNLTVLATTLKLISFFMVVNDVNDFMTIIKKNKVQFDDRWKHFKETQISEDVEKIHPEPSTPFEKSR